MSRTPASFSLPVVRGTTWEDSFDYRDADGVAIDLTGYEARMQVRTLAGRFGTTTSTTLLLSLSTTGVDPLLVWDTADIGRVRVYALPAAHADLNPDNAKKVKYAYWLEFYDGDHVLPVVTGTLTAHGTGYRA